MLMIMNIMIIIMVSIMIIVISMIMIVITLIVLMTIMIVVVVMIMIMIIELHRDLFSRHTINSPLEGCVFVAVDERCEDVMSDEICRRYNGKLERRRRGGRCVQLLDWVMDKIKWQHIIVLAWVTKMKSRSWGESLKVVQKVRILVLLGSFVIVGLISTREGRREEGTCQRRERKLPRVASRRSSTIVLCNIQGTRWRTRDGGIWVDRKGLDGGRDRTSGFLTLIKIHFLV